jgi:hypothetical protein
MRHHRHVPKSSPKSASALAASADGELVPSRRRGRRKSEREAVTGADARPDQLAEIALGLVALQASHDQLLAEVQGLRREVKALRPPTRSAAVSRRGKPPAAGG